MPESVCNFRKIAHKIYFECDENLEIILNKYLSEISNDLIKIQNLDLQNYDVFHSFLTIKSDEIISCPKKETDNLSILHSVTKDYVFTNTEE